MGHAGRPLWPHVPNSGFDSRDGGPPGFADRFDAAFPRNTDAGMVTLLPTVSISGGTDKPESFPEIVPPPLPRSRPPDVPRVPAGLALLALLGLTRRPEC